MRYQLIGNNDLFIPIEIVLKNRGVEDIRSFLNISKENVVHWNNLKNISEAVDCLLKHINQGSMIFIQSDSDVDGATSFTILMNYLKTVFKDIHIQWRIHEGKEHGIILDTIPEGTNLVIIPDAGSNQYKEHKKLKQKGIDVIVLDHHECDHESEDAIVVNNQLSSDYPTKSLTGAAIVYKFLKALDERLQINEADYYLDLVSVGLIADMADSRDLETRYYMIEGLKKINNSFLRALFDKQQYSTKGIINIINCQFYIIPLINACIRVGNMQEKLQMMNAFLESKEQIYNKRKKESESIQIATARLLTNIKARQKKLRDTGVELIEQRIKERNLLDNKILIVNVTDLLDKNLTGLVANSLSKKYKRPTLLIRYNEKEGIFQGSGRGYEQGAIKDLKSFLRQTGMFNYVEGHSNAHGVSIDVEQLVNVNEIINELLKDVEIDVDTYDVDFVIPGNQLRKDFIKEIDNYKNIWGFKVEEPLIAVQQIELNKEEINLIGSKKNTLKFTYNGIDYIKFFSNEEEWNSTVEQGERLVIDVIGKCSVNEYKGFKNYQIIINDFDVVETKKKKWIF